jgi:hypothetical protein
MKRWLLTLLLIPALGCSYIHKTVSVHPGAISNLDSYAYDLLLAEQDAINEARAQYMGGTLPAIAKTPLNAAIEQYNVAMTAWKSYHASGQGQPALQQALDALIAAVGALERVLGKQPSGVPASTERLVRGGFAWA